jgi:phenylacetate-CoA ligase
MVDIDPATATVEDLERLPPMVKQDAQDHWDAIVTSPDIARAAAERVLAQQRWFSYTPARHQVFSSGGSSGVRGVYVWDWEEFVTLACLAWRLSGRPMSLRWLRRWCPRCGRGSRIPKSR